MSSFKAYCPDQAKIDRGVKLLLTDEVGNISKDFLMVRWYWHDTVRAALDNLKREGRERLVQIKPEMSAKAKADADAGNKAIETELIREGIASQIVGWSFDEEASKENVIEFLKQRPDVANRVDTTAAETKLFFSRRGKSSSAGAKTK